MKQEDNPGLSRSGALAYDVFDGLLEGCQVISPEWRYLFLNDAVARQARRPKEELLGRTMMDAFPGIENTPMFFLLRRSMEDRLFREMENEFTFPDGSKGWFDLRFEPVPEGVLILSVEITERKHAQLRVSHLNSVLRGLRGVNRLINRESDPHRLLDRVCEAMVESRGYDAALIALTDEAREVLFHAEAGRHQVRQMLGRGAMPGCAEKAITSRTIAKRPFQEEPCFRCPIVREPNDAGADLSVALERDGRLYGFMTVAVPAPGADESAEAEEHDLLREVAQDVAYALHGIEIRQERDSSRESLSSTERQLWQAQKLEAVGRLAGGVAHDFNNILAAQMGYCDLLRDSLGDQDPALKDLSQIRACADRAATLTRQLLAFSRKQALQPEVLNLNAVVSDFCRILGRLIGEHIELVTVLAPDLGRVMVDAGQMEQVIMNLAVNARDAMPHGGKLILETANVELDQQYAKDHPGARVGRHVMLAVSDTGCGLDDAAKTRLFEPFFTTKEPGKGTGLGLSTVYGIVRQSEGSIWFHSEKDHGTTFKIFLPRIEGELTRKVQKPATSLRGRGELILVVEDERGLGPLFERMLQELGYRVRVAGTGADALLLVENEALRPVLLITDVVMPGMSGKDLAERLLLELPEMKLLYTSGYTENAVGHHGVLDSDANFLQKPFRIEELAAKIREVLD